MKKEIQKDCECPKCKEREKLESYHEEMSFAVLLALVPMLTLTLFGNIGLL
jgi:hypothetical protein